MKPWSPYNMLFASRRHGFFIYNALSGVMLELDNHHYRMAQSLSAGESRFPSGPEKEFIDVLEENGFLAEKKSEAVKLMALQYQRNAACFGTGYVGLTICPTLACNFRCVYCFEKTQDDATVMDRETMKALIQFIKTHETAKKLHVVWYGGEPLLAFGVMESLTAGFLEHYPDYDNAALVTNGYLLDEKKIRRLRDLRIRSVQITLDGGQNTHNQRRKLKNGGPTHERILQNIDSLMSSSWNGKCTVRVNVDRKNRQEYAAVHKRLLERYQGKNLTVYPGFVNTFQDHTYDHQCRLCDREWADLSVDGYINDGILPPGGFFPESDAQCLCIATTHYGYVIGPKGEIYKCWEDVGKENMVIGSLHTEGFITHSELVARYGIGTDPYRDDACMACSIFPICGGGCVNKRLRSQQLGERGLNYCSPFRESLQIYLEAYLETWRTRQICHAILGTVATPGMEKGYRMVQPAEKQSVTRNNPLENFAGRS